MKRLTGAHGCKNKKQYPPSPPPPPRLPRHKNTYHVQEVKARAEHRAVEVLRRVGKPLQNRRQHVKPVYLRSRGDRPRESTNDPTKRVENEDPEECSK